MSSSGNVHWDGNGICKACGNSRESWLKQDFAGIVAGHEFGKAGQRNGKRNYIEKERKKYEENFSRAREKRKKRI